MEFLFPPERCGGCWATAGADRAVSDCHFRKTTMKFPVRRSGLKWWSRTVGGQSDMTLGADGWTLRPPGWTEPLLAGRIWVARCG
jgi:hypothetical protein